MRKSSPSSGTIVQSSNETGPKGQASANWTPAGHDSDDRANAAQGPLPEVVSAAENLALVPALTVPADLSADALGRRKLSTAFVRMGPNDYLTVELRNGHVLALRNVVMHPKKYCGAQVPDAPRTVNYCGLYSDIAAVQASVPGGFAEPGPVASSPAMPKRSRSQRN